MFDMLCEIRLDAVVTSVRRQNWAVRGHGLHQMWISSSLRLSLEHVRRNHALSVPGAVGINLIRRHHRHSSTSMLHTEGGMLQKRVVSRSFIKSFVSDEEPWWKED